MHPVFAVVGPTGSGKSDLGLSLAREFQGEIVSCDSVQVYTGFDVGSAKVPLEVRQGIPHHLIDVIDLTGSEPAELTAGAYSRLARAALAEITKRTHVPIVVGGTGLYLRALFDGLAPAPERDETLRQRLTAKYKTNSLLLHRYLRRFDPPSAARIHPNDRQKTIRAVELTMRAGQPASDTQGLARNALTDFRVLKIGLNPDRTLLYSHLNTRASSMFSEGLLEETDRLLKAGVPVESKAMQSLGYKQAAAYLAGTMTLEEAREQCQIKTRQYAKRQLTWFRHDPEVYWIEGFGNEESVQAQAIQLCRKF